MAAKREPNWDIDLAAGKQAELWVSSVRESLAGKGTVEVKAPQPFLKFHSPYIEYACRGRDGKWRPSGIATTKAKLWFITFGSLPGGWVVETEWLRRAARLAFKNPSNRREETDGANPTRAVVVTMFHLWSSKEREP
jgi:hypothetical protein